MLPTRELTIRGYVVGQSPNAPLLAAIGAAGVERVIDAGAVKRGAQLVHFAALAIWAWLELTQGVNLLRRAFGAAMIAVLVARLYAGRPS